MLMRSNALASVPQSRPSEPLGAMGSRQSQNPFGVSEESNVAIPNVFGILRRQWKIVAVGCGIGVLLAIAYVVLATPLYVGTSSILLDTKMNQSLQKQDIIGESPVDTGLVDSQVEILSSESIALAVIRQLHLIDDAEFVGPPSALGAQILYQISNAVSAAKDYLGLKPVVTADIGTLKERTAVETFLKRLSPKRSGLTYVIDISFASESPVKAAQIANAVAQNYISSEMAAKFLSTKMASQWLESRLTELKTEATDADRALQQFKSSNNIVDTGRGLLNQQQISDLNSQLAAAKAASAEARARLDRMRQVSQQGVPDATVSDAISNSVITRLRAQYLDIAAREADLSPRLGVNHIVVVRLHDQMEELKRSIRTEEQRISDAYASDYAIASAREKSLADNMSQLLGEAGTNGQAQVKMRDLESSADTYRNLYDSFLKKYQQTMQDQTIPVTDTRIITEATTPLAQNSPKKLLAIAGGVLLGMFAGAGTGLARELLKDVFRATSDVERMTGITCLGILPAMTLKRKGRGLIERGPKAPRAALVPSAGICELALQQPYSRFTETLRNIKVVVDTSGADQSVCVLGIVSSVPREGKTTVAANLAALFSSSGGRTLLIDGDMQHRTLSAELAPDAKYGLIEAIHNPSSLSTLVQHRSSQLDVLPCVLEKRLANTAEVLGSADMECLLAEARAHYKYVVIELPPILPVVDAKAVARLIDAFVMVVEWGRSSRSVVIEALADSDIIRERMLGIVLNKADAVALRSIEAYKGGNFQNYFSE